MGYIGGDLKNKNVMRIMDSRGLVYEVFEGSNNRIDNWFRNY